jgi:hypothetical protein
MYDDRDQAQVQNVLVPKSVFSIFGLKPPETMGRDASSSLSFTRELPVPSGHADRAGRLDLLIRWGNQALVCVEVKVGPADGADTEKQKGYRKYLDEQTEVPIENCYGILLVTEASEPLYPGDFKPIRWSDVCLRLRRMIPAVVKRGDVVVAGMILAFVGAVEQNLLRFSSVLVRRATDGKLVLLSSEIGDHVLKSLQEET